MSQSNVPIPAQWVIDIAIVCHEANRAWCFVNGDVSQPTFDEAEGWQRKSAVQGVLFAINNPSAAESALHDAWMAGKIKDGWVYGREKDGVAKTHPCIVPFNKLSPAQQAKDRLFRAIVTALKE